MSNTSDIDFEKLAGDLIPVVEFYHPISPRWPDGAATISPEVLQESTRAFCFRGPRLASLAGSPQMLDGGLEKARDTLRPQLKDRWAIRVVLDGKLSQHIPEAASDMFHRPLMPEEVDCLPELVMTLIDLHFSQVQIGDQLRRRFVDESYVIGDISPRDAVLYEISKHYDPKRLQPAYSALLAHHQRLMLSNNDEKVRLDHLFAGYQTAAGIKRLDEYSSSTVEHVEFFRKAIHTHADELRTLSTRKKSVINFHLLTVDEGYAELYSYLSHQELAKGTTVHIRFEPANAKAIDAYLEAWLQRIRADQAGPYARGLLLYKTIYDRHGYAFSFIASLLCGASFKMMGNLLPLYVLSRANEQDFPNHPTALLAKLGGFECAHPNAWVKAAAAVSYLNLDKVSPLDCAINLLAQL